MSEAAGWRESLLAPSIEPRRPVPLLGVIPGEGVGPEVTAAALLVLRALEGAGGHAVSLETYLGPIGMEAERALGSATPQRAVDFCSEILARGGAVLNGPGGGRYVYELRRRLELFLKISPIRARNALASASPLRPALIADVDLLVVRENLGGAYQGASEERPLGSQDREVRHELAHRESHVRRFTAAAARLARARRGELTVVVKEGGMSAFSKLWREAAQDAAASYGVSCAAVDVDLMAYRLIERPATFDVIAASNLFGDVLSDLAAVLLGSRGISFSANFTVLGEGVYQTNHGSAHDLAGRDGANPVGHVLTMASALRESLGLECEAHACELGVRRAWEQGMLTADLAREGEPCVGTSAMAEAIAAAAARELASMLERT